MMRLYVFVCEGKNEDIEYIMSETHAMNRLRRSPTSILKMYVCEDGCIFHQQGVYTVDTDGHVVFDGIPYTPNTRQGYDHDTDDSDYSVSDDEK